MVRVVVFALLANIALVILALIDCLSAEKHEVRNLPRWMWALVILLFSPIGAAAWFLSGRPGSAAVDQDVRVRPAASQPTDTSGGSRQLAPDDNPDFLRDLSARTRKANEDRRRQWEDDLRRGEDLTDDPPPIG